MRRASLIALSVVALAPVGSASAAGGTYEAVFCHPLNRPFGGLVDTTSAFSVRSECSDEDEQFALQISSAAEAAKGRRASVSWQVDDPLAIVGVDVDARLRRANSYRAELRMKNDGGRLGALVAEGTNGQTDWQRRSWTGKPYDAFVASLECNADGGCPRSPDAKTWIRDLTLTIADYADPEIEVAGTLFEGGWIRGMRGVGIDARDVGAGIDALTVRVDENSVSIADDACEGALGDVAVRLSAPCPTTSSASQVTNTSEAPFADGTNEMSYCVRDFAGNEVCERKLVLVDNARPVVAFSTQNPDDPELIKASVEDEHSGLNQGLIYFRAVGSDTWNPLTTSRVGEQLQARVDSSAYPPGTYEFRVIAEDVAGNEAETMLREDGAPMTLEFPLKSGVNLEARLGAGGSKRLKLPYGKDSKVVGRLTDAAGEPMAGQPVVVDEDFGDGALIDHRIRTVMTDNDGKWQSKLPAGPSRTVAASFEGSQRYLDDDQDAGRVAVTTGARLGLRKAKVREGRAAVFSGRIGRLGARVPDRGKLLQLQYQDPASKRWFTVRNPFYSEASGRYRFSYEFGTHYVQDVAIKFRLRVPPEQNWPYRPTRTKARRVIVKAR